MDEILITEVAPRDGLQNQPVLMGTADKLGFIRKLTAAGLRRIEVASFVSPRAVPQMADAAEIFAALPRSADVVHSALVPNEKGMARALAAGAEQIAVVLSATETMNQRNIGMGLAETARVSAAVIRQAIAAGISTRAYVAVAFVCPFDGSVAPSTTIGLAEQMAEAGADEVVIADTIGAAGPADVAMIVRQLLPLLGAARLAIHLHDTRGLGLANAWAAIEAGARRFDSSAGGMGGCPFAPGAAGNLATEDLVLMAGQSGLRTGVDLEPLYGAIEFAQNVLGRPLGGAAAHGFARIRQAGNEMGDYIDADNLRSGFGGHYAPGQRPALLVIDFQRGFTDSAVSPLGNDCLTAIGHTNRLISAIRGIGPVIFTVVAYSANSGDSGCFHQKCPSLRPLVHGSAACDLDPALDYDESTDVILYKTQASAFFGTPLATILARAQCDMLVVTGCTTSGCVRASAVDAMQYGFPPFVAADAVSDRSAAQHESNLIDLQSKYAEVLKTSALLQILPAGS